MIVQDQSDRVLLIERQRFPYGFAAPAGHVDGDPDFATAAVRELKEEVGLESAKLEQVLERKHEPNPCRRQDGSWHHWIVYRVRTLGRAKANKDEAKNLSWYTLADREALAARTQAYQQGAITDAEWQERPGLEPVWYDFFKELKLI